MLQAILNFIAPLVVLAFLNLELMITLTEKIENDRK